ncbi:Uncharacterised protein [Dermatophilus congolensis]|uniref:Uncharacterized protein n=1 Tax=Dermatophilus congolensis TaxID=1863 RepID=A0AA46BME6_9MICO|nr:Uncharacterised protein [Dermatophilus congolensis]
MMSSSTSKEALSRAFKVPLVPVIVGVVLLAVAVGGA